MIIDNGERKALSIEGVFEGMAGVSGAHVSFVPNRFSRRPDTARAGVLAGVPVLLVTTKDIDGPFWTARFEVMA